MRVAQRLLYVPGRPPEDQHRTTWCHRSIQSKWGEVSVYRQVDGGGARFSGVTTCAGVWTCPVCAAKIAEARRRELSGAMVAAHGQGFQAYLLSLTFPHDETDQLGTLLERQAKALARLKNSRTYKGFMTRHGRAGSVRSLEVTWGVNGWHPHTHDLVFAAAGMLGDKAGIRALRCAWLRACLKAGLLKPDGTLRPFRNFWRHSLDLRGGDRAAEYIAKYGRDERWGISSEVTAPHAKVGIRRAVTFEGMHFTPFQLLEWAKNGDGAAARAFQVYAHAFEGKRMLSWSPGLKKRLGVADRDDEQLADDPVPEEEFLCRVTADEYGLLLSRDALGAFLRFVAECCSDPGCAREDIDAWLEWLRRQPRTHSDIGRRRSDLSARGWTVQRLEEGRAVQCD